MLKAKVLATHGLEPLSRKICRHGPIATFGDLQRRPGLSILHKGAKGSVAATEHRNCVKVVPECQVQLEMASNHQAALASACEKHQSWTGHQ